MSAAGATIARPATAHPGRVRPRQAPSAPRRVSGPLGRAPAPARSPSRPPRTQAPPRPRPQAPARTNAPARGLRERAAASLRSLPDHRLIDRLVRGRAWIPVLGLMLAGIVAMQVEVLKLGASVGRSIERGSALQTRNELLRANVASLSDETRIERLAAGMGMIMPAPGATGFLSGASVAQAIANIHAPSASTFLNASTTNGSVATTDIMSSSDGSIAAQLPGSSGTPGNPSATVTPQSSTSASAGTQSSTSATAATQSSTSATAAVQQSPAAAPTSAGTTSYDCGLAGHLDSERRRHHLDAELEHHHRGVARWRSWTAGSATCS